MWLKQVFLKVHWGASSLITLAGPFFHTEELFSYIPAFLPYKKEGNFSTTLESKLFIIIALQHSEDMDRVKDEQKLVLNEDEN